MFEVPSERKRVLEDLKECFREKFGELPRDIECALKYIDSMDGIETIFKMVERSTNVNAVRKAIIQSLLQIMEIKKRKQAKSCFFVESRGPVVGLGGVKQNTLF